MFGTPYFDKPSTYIKILKLKENNSLLTHFVFKCFHLLFNLSLSSVSKDLPW